MSNRQRLRAADRPFSRVRRDVAEAERLRMSPLRLRESATAVIGPEADVTESAPARPAPSPITITEATVGGITSTGGRRYRAKLIASDTWGSSGYYPRAMLERDVPKVFGPAAGPDGSDLMYLDHPTATEEAERPERSVRDLGARIVTTPVHENGPDGPGMYADIDVFPHAQPVIESLAGTIGLSIRGSGTAEFGEIGGRKGPIIESLTRGDSVDFVTRAGAGGKIVSLLEAARQRGVSEAVKQTLGAYLEARLHSTFTVMADDMYGGGRLSREERITLSSAIGDGLNAFTATVEKDAPQLFKRDIWQGPGGDTDATESARLREASTNEVQCALDMALRAAYGDDGDQTQWIYICDFDPDKSLVWFSVSDNQSRHTYQRTYQISGGTGATVASLTGDRTEVVPRTTYVPVPDTDTDAGTQVEESATELLEKVSDSVKSQFVADLKSKDTPVTIAAGMRRLSEWAASGAYPTGTSYADLKWFYNQCAKELKRRDKNSDAGGNFPAEKKKTEESAAFHEAQLALVECHALTAALKTVRNSTKEAAAPVPPTPVTDGTPPTAPTTPIEETSMSGTQAGHEPDAAGTTDTAVSTAVTEAETARAAVETKFAESERKRQEAETRLARFEATTAARPIATAMLAESELPAPAQARVVEVVIAAVPLTEANVLDEATFRTAVDAARTAEETYVASLAEAAGVGRVAGLGGNSAANDFTDIAATQAKLAERYIARGMSPDAAKIAAAGRP